jgi:hypothetical protein
VLVGLYDFVRTPSSDAEVAIVEKGTESETDNEHGPDRNDQVQQKLQASTSIRHGRFPTVVAEAAAADVLKLVDRDEEFAVMLDEGLAIGFLQSLKEERHHIPAIGLIEFAQQCPH